VDTRRQLNERFATFQPVVIVFAQPTQPTEAPQPGKATLDHPAARQHMKAALPGRTAHYLHLPAEEPLEVAGQVGAALACIHPQPLHAGQIRPVTQQRLRDQSGALPLADVARRDHDFEQEPCGIHEQMPFAAHHPLAAVSPMWPPCLSFSVVLTL